MRIVRSKIGGSRRVPSPQKPTGKSTGTFFEPVEKDIQKTILEYLDAMRIVHSVTNADRTWGKSGGVRQSKVTKGWPDVSGVLPVYVSGLRIGLSLYIEVKTPTGSISDEQKDTLTRLSQAGALCIVARNLIEVSRIIDKYKEKAWTPEAIHANNEILRIVLHERRTKATRAAIEDLV